MLVHLFEQIMIRMVSFTHRRILGQFRKPMESVYHGRPLCFQTELLGDALPLKSTSTDLRLLEEIGKLFLYKEYVLFAMYCARPHVNVMWAFSKTVPFQLIVL